MKKRKYDSIPSLVGITKAKVRFSEVDSMKIVWHGSYVKYFEDGREAFGREYPGIGYMDIYASGYMAPIVDLQIQYLTPLTIDDDIIIETKYIQTPAAKICFEYLIRKSDSDIIVARGSSVQVFIDNNGEMCLNNPPFYEKWKEKWIK